MKKPIPGVGGFLEGVLVVLLVLGPQGVPDLSTPPHYPPGSAPPPTDALLLALTGTIIGVKTMNFAQTAKMQKNACI